MSESNATKQCPFCNETIKAGAIKCRFCQEMLDVSENIEAASPAGNTPAKEFYRGSPSLVVLMGPFFKGAIVLAVAGLISFFPLEMIGDLGNDIAAIAAYRMWIFIVALVVVFINVGYKSLAVKSIKYVLTSDRLEYERGVFSKAMDNLDIFRIKDIKLQRSFTDRIFGVGTIKLLTSDSTHPELDMVKIRDSKTVYETLKNVSLDADDRRRVVHYE